MSLRKSFAIGITALMVLAAFASVMGPAMAQGDGNDVLRIAMQEDMPNFNNFDLSSNSVWKNYVLGKWVYDSLSGLDPGGNLFPQLAQNWTFDFDNLTVYLTLRPNVKFHDGQDCTADDIVFTYMSLRSGTTYSSNIINAFDADGDGDCVADEMDGTKDANLDGTFEGITKLDDHNVKFVLAKPYGQFFLQTLGIPIIPQHIWSSHLVDGIVDVTWTTGADAEDAAIGTGPFYYHSGEKDVFRRLVKFEDHNGATYWGTDFTTPVGGFYIYPQEVDEIYFTLYASLDTAILALQSGLVDHIPWTVTSGYVDDLLANPRTDVTTVSDNGYFYLAFNMKKEPMNYIAFRQAVSHVIDKTTIVERYMGGFGQPGDSSEPPFWSDWYNTSVKHYELSTAKASQVLTDGGFTGVGTSLKMPNGKAAPSIVLLTPPADYDPIRIKAGELVAKNLRSLGIDVVAKPVDFDTLVAKMNAFDFDMLIIGWSLTADPIGNVFDILGPKASSNTFGFWSETNNENPFYKDILGVSTKADAQTQAYADLVQTLADKATESFDRDEQIMYTKWAQGVLAEALPVNVLYYRVNNYATLDTWGNWINYLGELLNVYSIGTLTKGVVAPPSGEVISLFNLPDKLPSDMPTAGSVVVMTGQGEPIAGADVTLTGATFSPASGKTDVSGVFRFTVESSSVGWISLTANAMDGTTSADAVVRTVQVVPGVPNMVHLQVMPEKLFLDPGENTIVHLLVTDENGDGVEGIVVELEEALMGYGTISPSSPAEVTTDADGMATMTYTAPDPAPMNKHVEVRLSISPKTEGTDFSTSNVNTVTQFIVVKQPAASMWHFAQVEGATLWACNNTTNTTTISVKTFDEGGNPTSETLEVIYSNPDVLWNPSMTVTTDASGMGSLAVQFLEDIDTNATQVYFKNTGVANSVGAGANVLYKGLTMMDIYGGYFSIADVPMLDPDTDGNLTFDVYLYGMDGNMASGDTPVAIIVGEPADGSTALMMDAPDYMWPSLYDYTGINIFTSADSGALAAGGYFLAEPMGDAEHEAMEGAYATWSEFLDPGTWDYDNDTYLVPGGWYDYGPDEDDDTDAIDTLNTMAPYTITDGHAQISIARDSVVLSDNIPSLLIIPMGRVGFYATPDFANYWYEIHGDTAWKTEFVFQRTNEIYSVKYDMETGILRDFAPGNTSLVEVTVLDQDNNPVEGIGASGSTSVYGGRPYFDYTEADPTDASGMTSFTAIGMPATDRGTPLSTPAKQPLYIEASPDYGWSVFTSVEIFDVPVQLYLNLEVTPLLAPSGEVTQADVMATVVDENGDPVADLEVEFAVDEGSIDPTATTDASGMGSVMLTIPEVPSGDNFIIAKVKSSVLKEGYGAATAEYNVVSGAFTNVAPAISDLSIPETGYETEATTWAITGKATDDYGIVMATGSLDGADPVEMTLTGDDWSFEMSGLSVADHTAVITVEDLWGLTATKTLTFKVNEPTVVNQPPAISGVNIPPTGHKVNQGVRVTFTGKATDDLGLASLKYKLDTAAAVTVTVAANGDWSFNLTGLAVGNHTVVINATDNMGLFVTYTATFEVMEVTANTPPEITNVNIPALLWSTKKSTFTISGKVADAEGLAKLEIQINLGTPIDITPTSGEDWSYEFKDMKVGVYTVTVTATDTFNETDTFMTVISVLKEDKDETNWALWGGLIVIIIIVVLVAMMMMRKKPAETKPEPPKEGQ